MVSKLAKKKGRIGITIGLDGEKEFNRAITGINAQAKTLQAEMKKVTAEFKGNANSVEALSKKQEILQKQYDTQAKKVEVYQKALNHATLEQEKIAGKTEEYKDALSAAEDQMDQMKQSSESTNEELEAQREKVEKLKEALNKSERAYQSQETKINKWKTSLYNTEAGLVDLSRELQNTKDSMTDVNGKIDGIANKFDVLAKKEEKAKNASAGFGTILSANLGADIIYDGLKKITKGVEDVTKAIVNVGSDYESAMSNVAATMGLTVEDVKNGTNGYKELSEAAKNAGKNTKYSAAESAEALNYMAQGGYSVQEAISSLESILTGATAGGMELAYTSDMISDTMSALEIETKHMGSYIDKLAKTSQKTSTSMAQLGEGVLQVGGTARKLKGGVTELATSLGILADNGIYGAEGGTALRNIILAMTPTTKNAKEAWDKLGVSAYDANGKLRGLNEIFLDLNKAMDGMSDKERTNMLTDMFNKTDLKSVETLLGSCGKRFDKLSKQIKNSKGAAQEMADVMSNNLKGEMDSLSSATEALGIAAYEKFGGKFREAVSRIKDAVGDLADEMENGELGDSVEILGDKVGDIADKLIDFAISIIPELIEKASWLCENIDLVIDAVGTLGALFVFTKAINGIKTLIGTFGTLTSAIKITTSALNIMKMSSPIGLLAGAVGSLVGAWAVYNSTVEDVNKTNEGFVDKLGEMQDKLEAFEEKSKESINAFNENMNGVGIDSSTLDVMIDRLYKLAEVEEKSAGQKQVMKNLVDELNKALPELALKYNENKDKLNLEREAVEKLTKAKKEQLVQEALMERYKEVINEYAEAYMNCADAQDEYNKICKDFKTTEKEAYDILWKYKSEMEALGYVTMETQSAYDSHRGTIEVWTRGIDEAMARVNKYEESMANSTQTMEDLEKCMNDTSGFTSVMNQTKDATQAVKDYSKEVSKTADTTKDAVKDAVAAGKEAAKESKEVGKELVNGISAGIVVALPVLTGAMAKATEAAIKAAKKKADIHSPSKRTEKEIGVPLGQGAAKGVSSQVSNVQKAMHKVVEASYTDMPLKVNNTSIHKTVVQAQGTDYNAMKSAFTEAIKGLKLEFRGDKMADFVDDVVYEMSR